MSHPFPSLFAGKKKKQNGGYESTDDEGVSPMLARQTAVNPTAKQKVPDKDLMVGPCMTCDSVVRWPKDLMVFRCTVCLTINDLKPTLLETKRGFGNRAPAKSKSGHLPGPSASTAPKSMLLYQLESKRVFFFVFVFG